MNINNKFQTVTVEDKSNILIIYFNRPKVHNAFNPDMLKDLTEIVNYLESDKLIRAVIMTGKGESFSAGADLNWMSSMIKFSYEENLADAKAIADLFRSFYRLKIPVISAVNGAAIGGGMGFIAVSDIVLASEDARFGLSEVKIGLIPAVISTYLFRKTSPGKLKQFFLSGKRFGPVKAKELGLVNIITKPKDLLEESIKVADNFKSTGRTAVGLCKELFDKVPGMDIEEADLYTSEMLARLRTGDEAKEGMKAFLEKRKPDWAKQP